MSIPESQLDTWSHQGSITLSASTYKTIKSALESTGTGYAAKNYKVFLQGSYGNNTNIYAESDVDVVIRLDDVYFSDLSNLASEDKAAYDAARVAAMYSYADYKKDVLKALTDKFGIDVKAGDKAIAIKQSGNRRKADVITAMQFRRYWKFKSTYDQKYDEGICFFNESGERIANYPKQHSENMTAKHQASGLQLKPMVRILKNLRTRLVTDGKLKAGVAPSYYLEGLLYNVPIDKFARTYSDSFVNAMTWIQKEADKTQLVCANEQHYLLRDGVHNCWPIANGDAFLNSAIKAWNEWG